MKKILLIICFALSSHFIYADSPLTSTLFWDAYKDVPEVIVASECGGIITPKLMKYLNSKADIDKKVAVINAIGWSFNGHNNFETYKKYLKKGLGQGRIKAENILCLAYLKALDNYFDCTVAEKLANDALFLNPKSFTFNIIKALISAQVIMDNSFDGIWLAVEVVKQNQELNIDFRFKAAEIIYEYINLYAPSDSENDEYIEEEVTD